MKRALLFAALAATALGLDVKTYRDLARTPAEQADLNAHLEGFAAGVSYANAFLSSEGRQPLYCAPDKLTLNVKNIRDLMDTKIEEFLKAETEAKVDALDAEALLLVALEEAFPCQPNADAKKDSGAK